MEMKEFKRDKRDGSSAPGSGSSKDSSSSYPSDLSFRDGEEDKTNNKRKPCSQEERDSSKKRKEADRSQQERSTQRNDRPCPFESRILFGDHRLELIRKLGQGSFSKVYLVFDYSAQRYRVLKCSDFVDAKTKDQLKQEHRVLKKTKGVKGIPQTFGYYASENYRYILEEYVGGCELFDYAVTLAISFSERDIFFMFRTLHTILGSIHSRGIVHHDIKLENLMIDPVHPRSFQNKERSLHFSGPSLSFIDFGFAEVFDGESDQTTSKSGSLEYMAPEKLRHCYSDSTRPYSGKKSDIYSMGVVLFAVAYKCFPFNAEESGLRSKSKHDYPPSIPQEVKSLYSDSLFSFLCSLLILHPEKRASLSSMSRDPWVKKMLTP